MRSYKNTKYDNVTEPARMFLGAQLSSVSESLLTKTVFKSLETVMNVGRLGTFMLRNDFPFNQIQSFRFCNISSNFNCFISISERDWIIKSSRSLRFLRIKFHTFEEHVREPLFENALVLIHAIVTENGRTNRSKN